MTTLKLCSILTIVKKWLISWKLLVQYNLSKVTSYLSYHGKVRAHHSNSLILRYLGFEDGKYY